MCLSKALFDRIFFLHMLQDISLCNLVVCCLNLKKEFAEYSNITPSLHRALQHSKEFMSKYQSEGFTIGELSETAQEAFNYDDKANVRDFSCRGSFNQQNIDTIHRNWTASNPLTYFHMIQ